MDILKSIDEFTEYGLKVNSVLITRYSGQPATKVFINKLEKRNIKVYTHEAIEGYPYNIDQIVSDEGFGKNPYIPTTKPIVVVTAPGAGSGKLATSLSQIYHESKLGRIAGYSKFETFPVWNVPLKHPLNIAYEAATVDLKDVNMIDSYHYEAYGEVAVNYNRDIETFPVIKRIIERITNKESVFKSPTDMGVNRVGFGIIDDEVIKEASREEIIRRCFDTECFHKRGMVDDDVVNRIQVIMEEMELKKEDRRPVVPARDYAAKLKQEKNLLGLTPVSVMAFELPDGQIITGRSTDLMDSSAAAILNSIKYLANISDEILLLSPVILETIRKMKDVDLRSKITALNANEVLIALSISAVTNPTAQIAYEKLSALEGTQAHSTVMLNKDDEQILKRLGMDITSDPVFSSENLFYI